MNIMTKQGSLDNVITYEHYCDTVADLQNIPKSQITLGSVAIVVNGESDGIEIYIADSHKQWTELTSMSGGSGDSSIYNLLHICAQDEYNSNTLIPTIEEPSDTTIYLVPGGSGNNLYQEWINVNDNWEKFGIGNIALNAGDITFNNQEVYNSGTIGKEVIDLKGQKVDKSAIDNAGIIAKSYNTVMEETVTTVQDSTHVSPYALANTTYGFNKGYMYRVTINDIEYILPCELWGYVFDTTQWKVYEYIGNLNLYEQDTSGITTDIKNVPFVLVNDNINDNTNAIEVLTTSPGQYTIKLEKIENTQLTVPNSLIYGSNYYPIQYLSNGGSTYCGVSIGSNRLKNQRGTVAIGYNNIIADEFSIAIGQGNTIIGKNSSIVGNLNTVNGNASYSEGGYNTITGNFNHTEGEQNTVSGFCSHAEGRDMNISAQYSHGEGRQNTIQSDGNYAHAEGANNQANGVACHVEGMSNVANGVYSHAEGIFTNATHLAQHVFGFANILDSSTNAKTQKGTYIEIVGNGENKNNRSNARALDGDVYVGCGTDSTGGTKLARVGDIQVNGTSIISNGVANVPVGRGKYLGVVRIDGSGLTINSAGIVQIIPDQDSSYKNATSYTAPVVAAKQHMSTFYGLAKAAGDTTQSVSSNEVGNYTNEAKNAIRNMLGVETTTMFVENISGTTVTITGEPNTRYVCGEVLSISITPPQTGTIDVFFTAGSTVPVLTLPNTVVMPEWWTGVESGYTYEIVITDGIYGSVMAWPT